MLGGSTTCSNWCMEMVPTRDWAGEEAAAPLSPLPPKLGGMGMVPTRGCPGADSRGSRCCELNTGPCRGQALESRGDRRVAGQTKPVCVQGWRRLWGPQRTLPVGVWAGRDMQR